MVTLVSYVINSFGAVWKLWDLKAITVDPARVFRYISVVYKVQGA